MASWGEGMTTIPKQDLPFAEASEGSATPKNPKIITCDVDGTIMRRLDPLGDSKPDTDLLDFLLDAKGAGARGYHRVESHDGYERQDHGKYVEPQKSLYGHDSGTRGVPDK
jgi:hypothetical protein